MSISNLLGDNNYNLFSNSLTTNNLTVTGTSNLSNASARYNVSPQPPNRVGLIGGYLIFSSDPNPSFVPFTQTIPMGLYDYINTNGNFTMIDPYSLQINNTGFYTVSFSITVLSNSTSDIVFQLLSSQYPFTVGSVPPILDGIFNLVPISVITTPYSNAIAYNCSSNAALNSGDIVKLAYLTSADSEISLTSNFSINRIS